MWETALFALLLVIFFAFLRYLTREPAASLDGSKIRPAQTIRA